MTYMVTQPQMLTAASADVADIRSAISEASTAAAASTTGVEAMAADNVSAAISTLFRTYAGEYHALTAQAAAFHDEFARTLVAAGNAYANTEAASAGALGTITAPARALLARPSSGASSASAVALIMGASGQPIPSMAYIEKADQLFITPLYPNIATLVQQFTPEGFYTWSGIKALPINMSVAQGATILDQSILQQLGYKNTVTVFGYSQSSVVAGVTMTLLAQQQVSSQDVNFVLVGDCAAPNGGILERFDGLSFPSIGVTFNGATPSDLFKTTIYTQEYDGWADFPQYPIDLPADINAIMGMLYVHPNYLHLTANQITPVTNGGQAIQLQTQGPTDTTYYMIPTHNLPLLDPLRQIPVVGNPLADLLQPDMSVIVNWGYGNPADGWSQGPANVPTPFGLFPNVNPTTVGGDFAAGTQQGIGAFMQDVTAMGPPSLPNLTTSLSSMIASNPLQTLSALPAPTPASLANSVNTAFADIQAANTTAVNGFTTATSAAISILQPTADITNALVTTLPSYDLNLFIDGIQEAVAGNPAGIINAIGYPLAADAGMIALLGGLEYTTILWALGSTATLPTP